MKKSKSGVFQSMGLSHPIMRGIQRKGYKLPTPIQRKTIPLILEGRDVVAMARTGSGKTAAFLIPIFEKLRIHSAKVGARVLILSPTRELAMQTLTFAKELGRFTGLRAATVLGGDSIESQFAAMHENPDIIIATPGRLTHVCVEMKLRLESIDVVVFDEADRLFEMGFQDQLNDIISRLGSSRQNLMFSATLPKILVEFTRARLVDPILIRLDTEAKISENLKLAFFKINRENKLGVLVYMLKTIINADELTLVFVPTKHHVDLVYEVFTRVGINCTYVYSSLDPTARKVHVAKFRAHKCNIMVVTDVAARGIDIPMLDNVINVNFPAKPKLFVHRVGRVARAGRKGVAYSFVCPDELPYLLELHTFLSYSIKMSPPSVENSSNSENWDDKQVGTVPQDVIDDGLDYVSKLFQESEFQGLKKTADNAIAKYISTRQCATADCVKRIKEELWSGNAGFHPIFIRNKNKEPLEMQRLALLESLKNVRPSRTIFEVKGLRNVETKAEFMEEKRKFDAEKILNYRNKMDQIKTKNEAMIKRNETSTENNNQFIPYAPADIVADEKYSIGSNFEKESSRVSFDLQDEEFENSKRKKNVVRWDRNAKKFKTIVSEKKIKTESGAWVSASYRRDLYEKWRSQAKPQANENDESVSANVRSDWRTNKDEKKSDRLIAINEGTYRKKSHPLLKNKKTAVMKNQKGAARQLRTHQEKVKYVKEREKKIRFQKKRERDRNVRQKKFDRKSRKKKSK